MDDIKTGLSILKRAMKMEEEGRIFYMRAAFNTKDDKGKDIFNTLANDEQKHADIIIRQQTALLNQGQWLNPAITSPLNVGLPISLFPKGSKGFKKILTPESNDRDALHFGLDIEVRSYDLYRQAALDISDPVGKDMFEFLAGEEQDHFNILMIRYDFLFGPISWTF